MTKKNNEKMNIHDIMAMFIAYMKQEMEYTGMRIKAMKNGKLMTAHALVVKPTPL